MATTVIRRARPAPLDVPAEPVKIIESVTQGAPDEPDDTDAPDGTRSARAASARTDYDAVVARFKAGATNRKGAIRAHCVECMGGAVYEVARCTSLDCSLHPFRMGENPNDARTVAAKAKREAVAEAAKPAPVVRTARRTAAEPPAPASGRTVRRTRST